MIVCGTVQKKTKNKANDRKRMKKAAAISISLVITAGMCWVPTTVIGKDHIIDQYTAMKPFK